MTIPEHAVTSRPEAADPPPRNLAGRVARHLLYPFRRGERPERTGPAMGFYTDTTVCIGCKACEVACKQWNQLPADGFEFSANSYDNTNRLSAESWRHVKFIEQFGLEPPAQVAPGRVALDVVAAPPPAATPDRWLMMSDVCKHCEAAPCEHACPTGAIVYNEFGNVYIQPDICNGCAYCVAACPFGVITRSQFDGHAHKCTLCYDRQADGLTPACAKACPTASIQFGPLPELRAKARKRVDELRKRGETRAHLYGDAPTSSYSALHSFTLLIDKPEVYGLPADPVNPWRHMVGDYLRAAAAGAVALALFAACVVFG